MVAIVRCIAFLLLLAGCAPELPAVPGCALVPLGRVTVEVVADVPVVNAFIVGQPVRMLLDTGATFTVVTPQAVSRLGLRPGGRPIVMEGAGGRTLAMPVTLPEFVMGQARLRNVPAIAGRALDVASDGVLGVTLLYAFEIDLDVPNRVMTLYRARRCGPITPPWTGSYTELPAQHAPQGQLMVPIRINGIALQAVFDTGNSLTLITRPAAERVGLGALLVSAAPAARARTFVPGGAPVRLVPFERLEVGGSTTLSPVLLVADLPAAAGDALLGGDFVTTHRVWLALEAGQVFVAGP